MLRFNSRKTSPVILRSTSNTPAIKKNRNKLTKALISGFAAVAVIALPLITVMNMQTTTPASATGSSKCYIEVTNSSSSTGTTIEKKTVDCTTSNAKFWSNDKLASTGDSGTLADQKCYTQTYSSTGGSSIQDSACSVAGARFYSNDLLAADGNFTFVNATSGSAAYSTGGLQLGPTNIGSEVSDACGNPKQPSGNPEEYPLIPMWPGSAAGGISMANSMSPGIADMAKADAASLTADATYVPTERNLSSNYTAYEWYGNTPIFWENYSYEQEGGCKLGLDMLNAIPNILLSFNTTLTEVTSTIISWVTTADVVGIFFFGDNSVLANLITTMKDSFFLAYLGPIVFLSTLWLAWRGLVKRQSRDSIQGIIWMFAAAAAALTFMTNPTWFAKGANAAVFDISSSLINIATSTTSSTPEGQNGDLCGLPSGAKDAAVRSIKCSLWVNFTYLPWISGQIGGQDNQSYTLAGQGKDIAPTYDSGSSNLGMVLMDAKVYNRLDALTALNGPNGVASWGPPDSYKELKKNQWKAISEDVASTSGDGPHKASVYPFFSGQDASSRWNLGITALVGQLFAFIPLLILGLGMIGQQVIFVFLMVLSPLFLTIGIHPGYGRKLALGWLEMTLSTIVKRLVAAALIGVLLAYYGAVLQSTSNAWVGIGFLGSIVMIAVGSIAILVFRGRIMKQAGDVINLNGQQVGKGSVKNFFNGAGAMLAGGIGVGMAEKGLGGSFGKGFIKGAANNYNGPMPSTPSAVKQGISDHKAHIIKQNQKKITADKIAAIDAREAAASEMAAGLNAGTTASLEIPENRSPHRDSRPIITNLSQRPTPDLNNPQEMADWSNTWDGVEKRIYTEQYRAKETLMRQHEAAMAALNNSTLQIPADVLSNRQLQFEKELNTLQGTFDKEWQDVFSKETTWLKDRRAQTATSQV